MALKIYAEIIELFRPKMRFLILFLYLLILINLSGCQKTAEIPPPEEPVVEDSQATENALKNELDEETTVEAEQQERSIGTRKTDQESQQNRLEGQLTNPSGPAINFDNIRRSGDWAVLEETEIGSWWLSCAADDLTGHKYCFLSTQQEFVEDSGRILTSSFYIMRTPYETVLLVNAPGLIRGSRLILRSNQEVPWTFIAGDGSRMVETDFGIINELVEQMRRGGKLRWRFRSQFVQESSVLVEVSLLKFWEAYREFNNWITTHHALDKQNTNQDQ